MKTQSFTSIVKISHCLFNVWLRTQCHG